MNVRVAQIITGLVCTIFFLALALYRVQLGSVGSALAHANPAWIGAAIVAYAVNLSLRTRRWQIILRPVAAIPYRVVGRALLVGYGLNTIMPARLGKLFRAEFFKRSFGLSRVCALTSTSSSACSMAWQLLAASGSACCSLQRRVKAQAS
jgi:uncharacterized membrane protein YbhN (UPF0104 family)